MAGSDNGEGAGGRAQGLGETGNPTTTTSSAPATAMVTVTAPPPPSGVIVPAAEFAAMQRELELLRAQTGELNIFDVDCYS